MLRNVPKKTVVIAALCLISGLALGWLLFDGTSSESGKGSKSLLDLDEKTIWTCSMHPQIRQSDPGDCPICGMELIPLKRAGEEEADSGAIRMSPLAMTLADVATAPVRMAEPVKSLGLSGKVQADPRRVFTQPSHIPGRIESLAVNFTGELVRKGQTIAWLYSPELIRAQDELFQALTMKDTQPRLFSAARKKLGNWKLSDSRIDDMIASGTIQTRFPVTADISGYVTEKHVNPGDYVARGAILYEITDLSQVWVLFDVYESDLAWIQSGNTVTFSVSSLPGETFEGNIVYIDPVIHARTRVAQARVEVDNRALKLKPEMFVTGTVDARLNDPKPALIVPGTAVLWTGKRSVVYVREQNDQGVYFRLREVTLGSSLGDRYIVLNGLSEGEDIAIHGTFSIDAAAQLAGSPSMMSPEGSPVNLDQASPLPAAAAPDSTGASSPMLSQNAKVELQALYADYMAFKDALVADAFSSAQQSAAGMKTRLEGIDMGAFEGEAHEAWMAFSLDLAGSLEHVLHQNRLDELRKTFQAVSDIMIAMARSLMPLDQTVYVQHCPMADDNKGADWLSVDKEIQNPYYGQSMLTCGEVTATLTPIK